MFFFLFFIFVMKIQSAKISRNRFVFRFFSFQTYRWCSNQNETLFIFSFRSTTSYQPLCCFVFDFIFFIECEISVINQLRIKKQRTCSLISVLRFVLCCVVLCWSMIDMHDEMFILICYHLLVFKSRRERNESIRRCWSQSRVQWHMCRPGSKFD